MAKSTTRRKAKKPLTPDLRPVLAKDEKRVVFSTGATRCAAVAGEGKFPARFELIGTVGLRRIAFAYAHYAPNSNVRQWGEADHFRYGSFALLEYRAGKRDKDYLALAAVALCHLIDLRDNGGQPWAGFATAATSGTGGEIPPLELISPYALRGLAETYGEGAGKYGDDNWLKGMSAKVLLQHALAHFNQYALGATEEDDLSHGLWGLVAMMHFEELKPEMMDIQPEEGLIHR